MWSDLKYRVTWFWRRRAIEAQCMEELRQHVEHETEKWVRAGLARNEAERRAALEIGGIEQTREEVRDAYGTRVLDDIGRDVATAGRGLLREKRLTAALILTMALGIGANTAVVDVIDHILWRPLDVAHPDEVVAMYGVARDGGTYQAMSDADVSALRHDMASLAAVAGYVRLPLPLNVGGRQESVRAEVVTRDYFAVLSASPLAGRVLGPEDHREARTTVVSDRLWRRLSHDSPDAAIGRLMRIDGRDTVIVGVMPAAFGTEHDLTWGAAPDLWVPVSLAVSLPRGALALGPALREPKMPLFAVLARRQPSTPFSTVQAQLDAWSRRRESTAQGDAPAFKVFPAAQSKFWPANESAFVRKLSMLNTVATLVLLLSCVNITNLLLERSVRRRRELAVRASLGADRQRLVRQLLTEAVVLAAPAFAAALVVAHLLQRVLTTFPQVLGMPLTVHLRFSAREAIFCAGLSFLVAIGTSVFPAVRATRLNMIASLHDRAPSVRRDASWFGPTLVASQVAITAALLLVSLLMMRGVLAAYRAPLGYDPSRVVDLSISPPTTAASAVVPLRESALKPEAWGLSSVTGMALSLRRPLEPMWTRIGVQDLGDATTTPRVAVEQYVSAGFFSALQIPLLSGAPFDDADASSARPVAVVNATLARRLWDTEKAVGRTFEIVRPAAAPVRVDVVGVAPDIKWRAFDEVPTPYVYRPLARTSPMVRHVILRTAGPAAAALPDVLRAWPQVSADLPIARAVTGIDLVHDALSPQRLVVTFVGTFAGLAVIVAIVGIYSAVAWSVERRAREIALRVAIGGSPTRVGGQVIRGAIGIACAGAGVGLAAGVVVAPRVLVLDRGIRAADPLTLTAAAGFLVGAAVVAAVVPAWRASGINPLPILKGD